MSRFVVPPPQLNLHSLPPPILTSDTNSFAQHTLKVRIPRIVEETIELNSFSTEICGALEQLRNEILDGEIRRLHEATPDREFWDEVSHPYIGRTWLEVPWLWAEAYFYRRVLEATRYFHSGPWHRFDPYAAAKQTEWEPDAAPRSVSSAIEQLPSKLDARFEHLLHASLWGNRADLTHYSTDQGSHAPRPEDERPHLLADHSGRLWEFLRHRRCRRLAIVADNAGTELAMDLALADFLLDEDLVKHIAVHLKPQPFFVSDAMPRDVKMGLKALVGSGGAARALGTRLQMHLDNQRLQLHTHWLFATGLCYFQLSDDLRTELGAMDLVILKGDVNYRRLVGDVHWPPTTPFERATAYFPTPIVALRTLKAELIVGLRSGEADRLCAEDPDWLVNGRRGLIQARF